MHGELTGRLDEKGALTATIVEATRGDMEVAVRSAFRTSPEQDLRRAMQMRLQGQLRAGAGKLELLRFEASDPADTTSPFTLEMELRVEAVADLDDDEVDLRLPSGQLMVPDSERVPLDGEGALRIGGPMQFRLTADVELPPGWSAKRRDPLTLTGPVGELRASSSVENGKLKLERVLDLRPVTIPQSQSGDLDRFQKELATKLPRTVDLVRKNAAARAASPAERCDNGDARACANLGWAYAKGDGVEKDEARALELYEKACSGGNAWACASAGRAYELGSGVAKDLARAAVAYEKACSAGDARGCTNLGLVHEYGKGVPKDPAKAAPLYEKACAADHGLGCARAGYLHLEGSGVAQDDSKAAAFHLKGCELKEPFACSSLGYLYEKGRGVKEDLARAAELYRGACDEGDPYGCHSLGALHERGRGVEKDETRALELYDKACAADQKDACADLGMLRLRQHPEAEPSQETVRTLERACELGSGRGCSTVAWLHEQGKGVPKDEERSATLYRSGCDRGDPRACLRLAALYEHGRGVERSLDEAFAIYRRACDTKLPEGCLEVAVMAFQHPELAGDAIEPRALLQGACRDGLDLACQRLGHSMRLTSIDPPEGTPLAAGAKVQLRFTAAYELPEDGRIMLVFQRPDASLLDPGIQPQPKEIPSGRGEVTLTEEITVPGDASAVHVFVPLFLKSGAKTSAVQLVAYPVQPR